MLPRGKRGWISEGGIEGGKEKGGKTQEGERRNWVLFRLHREMHRALSSLPRRKQQLRETGETGENEGLNHKQVGEGGEYAKERELCSPRNKKNGEGKQKLEKTRK